MNEEFKLIESILHSWGLIITSLMFFVIGWIAYFGNNFIATQYFFILGSLVLLISLFPIVKIENLKKIIKNSERGLFTIRRNKK